MTSKFKIKNSQDKENCFKEFEKLVENKIWVELINKQHDHLEVEIEIKVSDNKENKDG